MTDTQLLTLGLSIIIPLSMLIYSNGRVSDVQKNLGERLTALETNLNKRMDSLDSALNKRLDDMKEVLRAETKAFRVEMLAEFRTLNEKIDTQMTQHLAEYHK